MTKLIGLSLACGLVCSAAQVDAVSYGKYLVDEVAKCGDCHTPRAATGGLDRSKRLKGAVLDTWRSCEIKNGAKPAPDLTSSSRLFLEWGERGMVKYLETGLDPKGATAEPPMPAYKLRPHDAEAIVAYLRTLK